jgi:uncharacterized protein
MRHSEVKISAMKVFLIQVSVLLLFALPVACQEATSVPIPELARRAESGDAQAQFQLGRAYEDGKGVAQDDARATELFRKSADQGNAQAQNSLGVMYALGRGVQQDKEEAVRWYKKAAKQGLGEGIYNVAISYYNGEGVNADMVAAYAWMTLAQSKGDPQAAEAAKRIGDEMKNELAVGKFQLALMYESGTDIPPNLAQAMELYRQVAAEDPAFRYGAAQFKLCQIYGNGEGVAQDYAQARSWCKLAAKRGNSSAFIALGKTSEQGLGGPIDLREAADWYQNAAIADVREGFMLSGELKLKSGSHDDQKAAYYWFFLAQKWKIPGADAKLQQASTGLTDKEIIEQQKKATQWLRESRNERMQKIKLH